MLIVEMRLVLRDHTSATRARVYRLGDVPRRIVRRSVAGRISKPAGPSRPAARVSRRADRQASRW